MGCCLVLLVTSSARNNHLGYFSVGGTTNWLATIADKPSYAAYLMSDFHSEQNSPRNEPIEWTNAPRMTSASEFRSGPVTNSPIR
jgi:hypothetical protein